jgi:hypothetical protein
VLRGCELRIGLRAAPDRLGGVVDEDVQRALRRHRSGQLDDLVGVAKVDADNLEAVQPLVAVGHRREPPNRVVREAGRDREVRAVAE